MVSFLSLLPNSIRRHTHTHTLALITLQMYIHIHHLIGNHHKCVCVYISNYNDMCMCVQCSLFIKDTIGPTLPVLNTCTV